MKKFVQISIFFAFCVTKCFSYPLLNDLREWLVNGVHGLTEENIEEFLDKVSVALNSERDHYQRIHLKKLLHEKQPKNDWKSEEEIALIEKMKKMIAANHPEDIRNEPVNDDLFEGDIIYTYEQMKKIENNMSEKRQKRQADYFAEKWENGIIYYEYQEDIKDHLKALIEYTMDYISSRTCIDFKPSSSAEKSVLFVNGTGCSSLIGSNIHRQQIKIGSNCEIMGLVMHEIMHALGFTHTMNRSDRDDYIIFDVGTDISFKNYIKRETTYVVPYEYASILHYPYGKLYKMYPRMNEYFFTMGSKVPTFYDFYAINHYYECNKLCEKSKTNCFNKGYPNPRRCEECLCPRGYGGRFCNEPVEGGLVLEAEKEWKRFSSKPMGRENNFDYVHMSIWINAPNNGIIGIRSIKLNNFDCKYGCEMNGLQIQYSSDPRHNDPINCCQEYVMTIELQPSLNPAVINYHGHGYESFEFEYRYRDKSTNIK